ncbi:uncharacterized protein O3C94_016731 [Discoglossus pictus]
MNKGKKKEMAERFLNYALEIIYLLTGEEYTIVKRNSSNSSTHHLTGKVPIKCGDVTVYFSMEEWDYIEGHKELYKDMMMEDHLIVKDLGNGTHKISDTVSICDGEDQRDRKDQQQVETHSDLESEQLNITIDPALSAEEEEGEMDKNSITQLGINPNPHTGEVDIDVTLNAENREEQEIYDHINSALSEGNLDNVSISEEEGDGLDVNDLQLVQIKSESSSEHEFLVHESINRNLLEETHKVACSLDELMSVNASLSQGTQGHHGGNSPSASTSYGKGILPSTSVSYNCEQAMYHNDVLRREMQNDVGNCAQNIDINSDYTNHPEVDGYYPCDKCEIVFYSSSSLFGHQRIHNEDNPNRCNECGKHFSKKANLVVHQRLHTGVKPFMCNECNKKFSSKSSLLVHEKIHTGEKPHMCNICGKFFAHKYYLFIHQRSHTGEKPYSCIECNRLFTYKSSLLAHQKTHTGEKPYECSECGKHFAKKSNLDVHRRSHTGEKLYSCDECGKSFAYRSQLSTHKKSHNKEEGLNHIENTKFSCL